MPSHSSLDWMEFINDYPGMKLRPQHGALPLLKGFFEFTVVGSEGRMPVTDAYELAIAIPKEFPKDLPVVSEIGNRIPHDGNHHINSDGSLCMGTPLRLLIELSKKPTLIGFAEKCLVPYLYAMSLHLNHQVPFVFGELEHGHAGLQKDCLAILGLRNTAQLKSAMMLLGVRERHANKYVCPCGCGKRLSQCHFRHRLNELRRLSSLEWFRKLQRSVGLS